MATKEEKKQYLQEKVNPIIERLIVDILAETPEDVVSKIFLFLVPLIPLL